MRQCAADRYMVYAAEYVLILHRRAVSYRAKICVIIIVSNWHVLRAWVCGDKKNAKANTTFI